MTEFMGISLDGLLGGGNAEIDKVIALSEIEKLEAITSTIDRLVLLLGVNSGISIEELLSIRKIDIDFDAQTISVYDKVRKQNRLITIPKPLMDDIRAYFKTANLEMNYLFNFTRPTLDKKVSEWTERSLGYKRSWKSLRRTFISQCANRDWGIYIASSNSGLSANELIAYFALTPQQKREILNNGEPHGRHNNKRDRNPLY